MSLFKNLRTSLSTLQTSVARKRTAWEHQHTCRQQLWNWDPGFTTMVLRRILSLKIHTTMLVWCLPLYWQRWFSRVMIIHQYQVTLICWWCCPMLPSLRPRAFSFRPLPWFSRRPPGTGPGTPYWVPAAVASVPDCFWAQVVMGNISPKQQANLDSNH